MKLLNLGCGDRFLPTWINVDFNSTDKEVLTHNLLLPLPFESAYFDATYTSHVLEHFSKNEAVNFISEIYRTLKSGGILRVVVPNLERFAKGYLDCLDSVRSNENELSRANHEWSVIELLDQMVRVKSGGEMFEFWKRDYLINEDYVTERLGYEFKRFRSFLKNNPIETKKLLTKSPHSRGIRFKIIQKLLKRWFHFELDPDDFEYLRFRKKGELHKWMYDEISLKQLLEASGFRDIKVVDANTSRIDDWNLHMFLDVENNEVRKPDSLFMEAIK